MADDSVKSIQDYRDQLYAEDQETKRKTKAISEVLGNDTLVAADVLAKVVAQLPYPTLGWENAIERFWGDWIRLYALPDMERVYQAMVNLSALETAGDYDYFYIPSNTLKIIVYPSNFNILFLWNDSGFHLRQFWNKWGETQEDEGEDPADYSDHFPGNESVTRPDLEWYKKKRFVLQYGDCRDVGYIGSYKRLSGRVDRAIAQHTLLKIALGCYVPSLVEQLLNREAVGPWKTISRI